VVSGEVIKKKKFRNETATSALVDGRGESGLVFIIGPNTDNVVGEAQSGKPKVPTEANRARRKNMFEGALDGN